MHKLENNKYTPEPLTLQLLEEALAKYQEQDHDRRFKKIEHIEDNLKHLLKKEKEFNEPIPAELIATVYADIPRGAEFFKRFEKWLK